MSGLVLKLAPRERLLINGAVIENGARRGRLNIMTAGAHILRLKDAIHPEEANTPVRRLCYAAQLTLSGDKRIEDLAPELLVGIAELSSALRDAGSHEILSEARQAVVAAQPYQALKALRKLLPVEDSILGVPVA
ncbi:flagellar biosynthesis repressor FlbT [Palleronia abyssalis]|uniref:Flagellum biosynthesis repressor protein FlbT n=1 Tax=Palleronia abyssalis TaxID=1501240 RepID=A0A2R8BWX6_9RHOB|nr:flagellar biosynthesis repressor FlbT [Palleronia abyssalis]SPJ24633.1 flagellum biosynthesis repressor protein FlbT [Palleronia abyssalis]